MFLQTSTLSGQNEEEKLRRKLSELAGNLSDKGLSSDDELGKKPFSVGKGPASVRGGPPVTLDSLKDKELSSSSDEMPTEAQKVKRRSELTHLFRSANGNLEVSEIMTHINSNVLSSLVIILLEPYCCNISFMKTDLTLDMIFIEHRVSELHSDHNETLYFTFVNVQDPICGECSKG